jgi:hypothetical protein
MTDRGEYQRTLLVVRFLSSGLCGKASLGKEEDKGLVDNAGNLTKDLGDLSLIKGVMVQGEAASGTRRVLKHMRYDRDIVHFVPTEKRKQNCVVVGYKADTDKHRILQEMHANGHNTEAPRQGREQGVGGGHRGYRCLLVRGDWAHVGAALANKPDTVHCGQEVLGL